MGVARESAALEVAPADALGLWSDPGHWRAFIDGFARVVTVEDGWPEVGARLEWESVPQGRGRVSERVEAYGAGTPALLATRVSDQSLTGLQTVTFEVEGGGTRARLELDYTLTKGGALSGLTDLLFIRRALAASLRRTLERFAWQAGRAPDEGEPRA